MRIRIVFLFGAILLGSNAFAQQQAMPGRILVRIKPSASAAFRSAFFTPEIRNPRFDPQKFSLKSPSSLVDLLGIPSIVEVTSIKPLIPQHNVVLEELRERTNPILFHNSSSQSMTIRETEEIEKLRTSEEKISRWFEFFYDGNLSPESVAAVIKKSSFVESAEPRYRYKLCFTPNDPLFSEQYALPLIHAPEAWNSVRCDSTMLVADDDIGSDWTHPDLAQAVFVNSGETGFDADGFDKRSNGIDDDGDGFVDDWHGWDFAGDFGTSPDNDPNTPARHGTHTAGIMAASGNNSIGICGVAFGAKILILKCGDNGGNDVAFGYEGIIYAADHHALVVNNSWGGTNRSQVGQDIVDYAISRNCVVVAASGNSGTFDNLYPASYDHVLSVAAVDEGGNITSYSNFNAHVDVSAPGNNIESTVPGAMYATMIGTSMASPNASGAIAMIRQKFPNFTADQAAQRLRATTSPRSSTQDIHPGYTGTGLIDLKQAVSDAPAYSARLESVEILDDNHNGILESGEGADIVLHVRNYLDPVTDLQAKIEYIDDTFGAISANTETVRFGKANTLELVQNFQGSFHVNLAKNTPADYTVSVRVTFSSSPQGYGPDLDYFSLSINQAYLSLNQNNLTVTFNSKGGLGYNDPPGNTQGMGFVWTKAPSSIVLEGRDILSQAGLMIGVDDSARIVSAAPGEYGDGYTMQDFSFTKAIHYVTPPDHTNAVQELHTTYADVNADPSLQVGVAVDQRSYAFTNDLAANAVVIDYLVRKRTVDSVSYLTDSTAMALFMDWDIGASGSINRAYVSALDSAIGITRRMEDAYPFVGIKLLSDIPAGSSMNFYALDNDGSNGSVNKYDGLDRSEKWRTMTTPRPVAGIGDVSMIYGLKNLPLRSKDSVRLTFVIALGENEQMLKQTIDATEHEWQLHSGIPITEHRSNLPLEISPNPFSSRFHIAWNSADPSVKAEISISDAIGRIIETRSVRGSSIEISGLILPAGTYFVSVRQGSTYCRGTIVSMP